jgi:hypothetical protein
MSRTKHGRAVAKAIQEPTRQELEAELNDACAVAKKAKTSKDYDEAHSWMNDILTELDKLRGG